MNTSTIIHTCLDYIKLNSDFSILFEIFVIAFVKRAIIASSHLCTKNIIFVLAPRLHDVHTHTHIFLFPVLIWMPELSAWMARSLAQS